MIRYNYHQSTFERRFGRSPAALWDDRFRAPLLAIGFAFCVVAALWLVETRRLATLDADLAVAHERTARVAREAARVEVLAAGVRRRRVLRDEIGRMQRETRVAANDVASIANRLPAQTWLTALRDNGGSWSIAGRSAQLVEIAAMLRSVDALEHPGAAQLVSVSAGGHRRETLDFVIALERHP